MPSFEKIYLEHIRKCIAKRDADSKGGASIVIKCPTCGGRHRYYISKNQDGTHLLSCCETGEMITIE